MDRDSFIIPEDFSFFLDKIKKIEKKMDLFKRPLFCMGLGWRGEEKGVR